MNILQVNELWSVTMQNTYMSGLTKSYALKGIRILPCGFSHEFYARSIYLN